MRVDRSLLGVIGIAIVLSTLITLFIIGERAEEDVTILRDEFPPRLSTMEQKYAFVLSMIARKPLVDVTVKYNVLSDVPEVKDLPVANLTVMSTDEETIRSNLPRVESLLIEADRVGKPPDTWEEEIEWKGPNQVHKVRMYMYDFTDLLKATAPGYTVLNIQTTYVVWINTTNDAIARYFVGSPDYFYNRNSTIVDLTITHNDDSQYYRAVSEIEVAEEYKQIMQAPLAGTVTFEDVVKDDRLFIIYSLKGTTVPGHTGMLQLVRVYRNGELETFDTNYMTS
jgi:hypothetical protein